MKEKLNSVVQLVKANPKKAALIAAGAAVATIVVAVVVKATGSSEEVFEAVTGLTPESL